MSIGWQDVRSDQSLLFFFSARFKAAEPKVVYVWHLEQILLTNKFDS